MAMATLDQFRAFLDHFDGGDRADVLAFFQYVGMLGEECLGELSPRLQKSIAPRELRRVILETAFYLPWNDWIEPLAKVLRHEPDLELFEAGAMALGRIPDPQALLALRELHDIRPSEAFQAVLSRVLAEADPREAFAYHMGRLLEGSGNARVANEAAAELTRVVSLPDLDKVLLAVHHPDLLVARHALRLVTHVHDAAAAQFLLEHLVESHRDSLADRQIKEELSVFRGTSQPTRQMAIERLSLRFGASHPRAVAALAGEEGLGSGGIGALQLMREASESHADQFLLDAATLVLEGKPAKLATLAVEMADAMGKRARRLGFSVDACAEGLGVMVLHGVIPGATVLPPLKEAYQNGTGKEGVARVLAQLVDPEDQETLDLILACAESAPRAAALEAVGRRRLEGFLPFLLKACLDPIVDVAQRAMVAVGELAGAPGTVVGLVESTNPEEVRLGIRIAGINRMEGAASTLLEFLKGSSREDLSLEAIASLGNIGLLESGDALLDLLHAGQGPRVQVALAHAIRDMGHPDLAHSLCMKATHLRNPVISAAGAEAMLVAHPDRQHPLSTGAFETYREQVRICWDDKDPWGLRARLVEGMEGVHSQDPGVYDHLTQLIQAALADKRIHTSWSMEQQGRAASMAKELTRRGSELRQRR